MFFFMKNILCKADERAGVALQLTGMLLMIAVISIGIVGVTELIRDHRKIVREKMEMAIFLSPLPPGTDPSRAPIPQIFEQHLGSDWVIAKALTNQWSVVVYYDRSISILNARRVSVDLTKGLNLPASQAVIQESLEVFVSLVQEHRTLSESFRFGSLLQDLTYIFIGVDAETLAKLKARVPKPIEKSEN